MRRVWLLLAIGLAIAIDRGPLSPQAVTGTEKLADYQWLLHSPERLELSGAADSYLMRRYESSSEGIPPPGRESPSRPEISFSSVKRVNDPSKDFPDATTQSEPSLAVFGSHIVVSFNDSAESTFGDNFMGFSLSHDGGKTFTDKGPIQGPDGGSAFGDPSVAVDRQGIFYIASLAADARGNSGIGVARSTDFGETLEPMILASNNLDLRNFQDKELLAIDNTDSPYSGALYLTWTEFFFTGGTRILFARSTDGGRTFSTPVPLSQWGRGVQNSVPVVGPHGELYVVWRQSSEHPLQNKIIFRRSTDGGESFDPRVEIASTTLIGVLRDCNGRRMVLQGDMRVNIGPMAAVDHNSGAIYVVYSGDPDYNAETGANGPDMSDVFLVTSDDQGQTWSSPVRVNDDTTHRDQWFPAVAVAPNGTVGVMFYDRRLDPKNGQIDVFLAMSSDGGQTFKNRRISRRSFSPPTLKPNFDPLVASCYMGDYNWITADEKNFYVAWGDNRDRINSLGETRPDPNVFVAIEPVPSLSDNRPRASIAVSASPNPVTSPHTTEFRVTGNEVVSIQLQIFDLAGRRVFHSGEIPELTYRWHLDRDDGKTVADGVYLYRVLATTAAGEKILSELKKIVARR
ncbi:hypothetical protein HY230_12070 [Candidatus Acetothermia bacterium]|nr:hypothetical protein [Candidatus Acetothermia bacterium]MBI3661191.1 hypothetical protein [Candidatus Acetothermia bacterium]